MSKACDSQLSSGFNAALMPPAAATEWDRTGWTFETTPTVAPVCAAANAARWPASPAPMIRTSCAGTASLHGGQSGMTILRGHALSILLVGDPRPGDQVRHRTGPRAGDSGCSRACDSGTWPACDSATWGLDPSQVRKTPHARDGPHLNFRVGGRYLRVASSSPALTFARPPADTLPSVSTSSGRRVSWVGATETFLTALVSEGAELMTRCFVA